MLHISIINKHQSIIEDAHIIKYKTYKQTHNKRIKTIGYEFIMPIFARSLVKIIIVALK